MTNPFRSATSRAHWEPVLQLCQYSSSVSTNVFNLLISSCHQADEKSALLELMWSRFKSVQPTNVSPSFQRLNRITFFGLAGW